MLKLYSLVLLYLVAVCDSVNIPVDGNVTFNTDGSETVATFLCNLGYTMVGTNTLTCRSDGTWNYDVPTCGKYKFNIVVTSDYKKIRRQLAN